MILNSHCVSEPQGTAGRVAEVADGDTLTILASDNKQIRFRLRAIDVPERKQAFGSKSREVLSEICAG